MSNNTTVEKPKTPSLSEMHMPPRVGKQSLGKWLLWVLALAFLLTSINGAEFSFINLAKGIPNIGSFLAEALPPSFNGFDRMMWALLETFQMALVGTFFGVLVSLPVAVLAARSQTSNVFLRTFARGVIAMFRTIPDLIWALIFVISVGLGPFAGTLTIMVDTIGFCARFFAEAMEEVDRGPQEALKAMGVPKISIIACAVFPGAFPSFVNTILFALEKATRSSVVLGLVGAGGIGLELKVAMDMFQYTQAATIILAMFFIVLFVERASVLIRSKII